MPRDIYLVYAKYTHVHSIYYCLIIMKGRCYPSECFDSMASWVTIALTCIINIVVVRPHSDNWSINSCCSVPLCCSYFSTVRAVLHGACHMVSMQLACEPVVRQVIRQVYQTRAVIIVKPTKKGRKVITVL